MKTRRNQVGTINAGSMADIAFLLLLFFLVATTISADQGILRQLPPPCLTDDCDQAELYERNVLEVFINHENNIMIEDELVSINEIKTIAKDFIDNNGDGSCTYCHGQNDTASSDHPKKAVISLQHAAQTKYGRFIEVQDEISKAYAELRNEFAMQHFNKPINQLTKNELRQVKQAYPLILSEAKVR